MRLQKLIFISEPQVECTDKIFKINFNKKEIIGDNDNYYHIRFKNHYSPKCQISSSDTKSELNSEKLSLTTAFGDCGIKSDSNGKNTVYKQTIIISTRQNLEFFDAEWNVQCEVGQCKNENEDPKAEEENKDPKADDENYDPKAEGENNDPKAENENKDPKAQDENEDPKAENGNKDPKVEDKYDDPKAEDENKDPKAEDENEDPKAGNENKDPKAQDKNEEPKAKDENKDPKAEEHTFPYFTKVALHNSAYTTSKYTLLSLLKIFI